jgi:peroxiredoxin
LLVILSQIRPVARGRINRVINYLLISGIFIGWVAITACGWLCWQLVQQNGRILLQLEALEKRIEGMRQEPGAGSQESGDGQSLVTSAATNDDQRAERFGNRSLAASKIKRDGLRAGTVAPEFRLPRLDGGELALSQLRGRLVLLAFSSPHCGPCNGLAPKLQNFHRKHPELELVMISRGSPDENRAKVKEHGLTFPVVLQRQWEVSRDYAMFATPVAYLIDEGGVILADVAVGVDAVVELMSFASQLLRQRAKAGRTAFTKRLKGWLACDIGLGVSSRRKDSRSSSSVSGSL